MSNCPSSICTYDGCLGNVIKEIVDPAGATVYTKAFTLGDQSINSLELWTAEYQESDAILVDEDHLEKLKWICDRERCNLDVVGRLNGSGQIILSEESNFHKIF